MTERKEKPKVEKTHYTGVKVVEMWSKYRRTGDTKETRDHRSKIRDRPLLDLLFGGKTIDSG